MSTHEIIHVVPKRTERDTSKLETSSRLSDAERRTADYRRAIQASTDRILSLAFADEPDDSDPEAA